MRRGRALGLCLLLLACGRTVVYDEQPPPPVRTCSIRVEPEALDFERVLQRTATVSNAGDASCTVSGLAVRGDPGFSVPVTPGTFRLAPAASREVVVEFTGTGAPFERTGLLSFDTDDPQRKSVEVPLTARIPHCELALEPVMLVFAARPPGGSSEQTAFLSNRGTATCTLRALRIDSDPSFSFAGMSPSVLAEGARTEVRLRFTAPQTGPKRRTATLVAAAEGEIDLLTVALEGTVQLCDLSARPNPFDFGNVPLNTTATHTLTFSNGGEATCVVSGFTLLADPLFSLPVPPGVLTIAPGGTRDVIVRFAAFDSAPPHQRTGVIRFNSNDPEQALGSVPVSAFINTICTQAGQFIYTVDRSGTFSRFDPSSLTSTTIGQLSCSNMTMPFSMNLDQSAKAWIVFDDGRLHTVDVTTAACITTSFVPGQNGFQGFGMGSVFDSTTGKDTLYIAGGPNEQTLGTLDLVSLSTAVVGQLTGRRTELAGTGDGQLWAYTPSFATPNGTPTLDRVDRMTGATLEHHDLPAITSNGGYAIKFWGGAFYVFIGADVWKVPRNTLLPNQNLPTSPPTRVFTRPGLEVVGAGVSTCAPVMGP